MQLTANTHREPWYFAGESPTVDWRTWPVTGGMLNARKPCPGLPHQGWFDGSLRPARPAVVSSIESWAGRGGCVGVGSVGAHLHPLPTDVFCRRWSLHLREAKRRKPCFLSVFLGNLAAYLPPFAGQLNVDSDSLLHYKL